MTASIDISSVREYWDRQPCNIRHSTSQPGSQKWSYDLMKRRYFVEPHIIDFMELSRWQGKKVLEVGCGVGTDALVFSIAGRSRVWAIDLSSESIELARQRKPTHSVPIHWDVMNAEESLPEVEGGFDLIYCFGMLHHTPCPEKVLELMKSRLSTYGELKLMLYAKWSIKHLSGQQPEAQSGCPLAKVYTASEASTMLSKAGFTVQRIKKAHIFPYKVGEYVQYHYVKHWYYRGLPISLLGKLFGWHLLITAHKTGGAS